MKSIQTRDAVRCFAQTGPPRSCLEADETRLHLLTDGRWVLEAWNYVEDDEGECRVDRWFRVVGVEQASAWLARNGFDDETEPRRTVSAWSRQPRGTSFVPVSAVTHDWLTSATLELEDAG